MSTSIVKIHCVADDRTELHACHWWYSCLCQRQQNSTSVITILFKARLANQQI